MAANMHHDERLTAGEGCTSISIHFAPLLRCLFVGLEWQTATRCTKYQLTTWDASSVLFIDKITKGLAVSQIFSAGGACLALELKVADADIRTWK
jgi:hypothetical protein